MILDFYTDNSKRIFYKLASNYTLPEFVKEANISSTKDLSDIPDSTFADNFNRAFPCHTKADTVISYLYFNDQLGDFDKKAAERIEKGFDEFFKLYGLDKDALLSTNKSASKEEDENIKYYGVKTANDFADSVKRFLENCGNYSSTIRKDLSRNFLKVASDKNFNLESDKYDFLTVLARYEDADAKTRSIELLKLACHIPPNHADYENLTKLVENVESIKTADLFDALDEFMDRRYGNENIISRGLPLPEQICFTSNERKIKEAKENTIKIGNKTYPKAMIESLPMEVFSSVSVPFAENITDDGLSIVMEKFASNLSTLDNQQLSQLNARIKDFV